MLDILNIVGLVLSLISAVGVLISTPKLMYGLPNGEDLKEIAAQKRWKGRLYRISLIVLVLGILISILTHPFVVKVFSA